MVTLASFYAKYFNHMFIAFEKKKEFYFRKIKNPKLITPVITSPNKQTKNKGFLQARGTIADHGTTLSFPTFQSGCWDYLLFDLNFCNNYCEYVNRTQT